MSNPQNLANMSSNDDLFQEIEAASERYQREYERYMKNKILHDAVQVCLDSGKLHNDLSSKVEDILMNESSSDVVSLQNRGFNSDSVNLLGLQLSNIKYPNYTESMQLEEAVKETLDEMYKNACVDFFKITNQNIQDVTPVAAIDPVNFEVSTDDRLILQYREQLMKEQRLYVENLEKLKRLLEDVTELRLKKLPNMTLEKIKEYETELQVDYLQSRLLEERNKFEIFTETSYSFGAYKEILNDIVNQQNDCKEEIRQLIELKQKYKEVSCKQYDEILKSYIQCKAAIVKKKILLDSTRK